MRRVLVTGAAGFIGHHFVEHLLKETGWELVLLCRLSKVGNLNRLTDVMNVNQMPRVTVIYHDLQFPIHEELQKQIGEIDFIFHLGASTHVDRSIIDPLQFVKDNVLGTTNLLEYARKGGLKSSVDSRFIYFSTDEVFGPAPEGVAYKEWDRYNSGNPYAATKAGAEEMCLAYHNTYGVPVIISHCMNVFGERQHKEKFIPLCIDKILKNEMIQIHTDKTKTIPGSRFYIHARNVASAVVHILMFGKVGEKYNIVGEREVNNLDLARLISHILGFNSLSYKLVDFHSSRPGHDLRYALDGTKLAELCWKPPVNFHQSLHKTVKWIAGNDNWL